MRFNNSSIKNKILVAYFLLAAALVACIISFKLFNSIFSSKFLGYIIIGAFFLVSFLIIYTTGKYFEYDSDGDVLVFVSRGLILSEFTNYRENKAEFPKGKLMYYKLNNYVFYKSLNLYIRSGVNKQKRLRFNVSLVRKKKLKYLKQSLDKVVKQNKENL